MPDESMENQQASRNMRRRRSSSSSNGALPNIFNNRTVRRESDTINDLLSQAALNLYGTDRESETSDLTDQFNKILSKDIDQLTNGNEEDISSFLSQLVSSDKKSNASNELLNNQFMSLTGDEYGTMQSFIYDAYRNQLLEQSDLHEVSNQLIELSEAILITRDAIISPDVVEGRLSRDLTFKNLVDNELDSAISTVESVEKKFELLDKIKNFIIPKTLEYGNYYAYIIPYAKLFNDFMKNKDKQVGYGHHMYRGFGEAVTLMESFEMDEVEKRRTSHRNNDKEELNAFLESAYEAYSAQPVQSKSASVGSEHFGGAPKDKILSKQDFFEDVSAMLGNISICNDPVPLPVFEEGIETISAFRESFVNESGDQLIGGAIDETGSAYYFEDKSSYAGEASGFHEPNVPNDLFNAISNAKDGGVSIFGPGSNNKKKKEKFDDIRDCYIKMIEPTRIIPLEILDTVIGYYYVQDEDITPLDGGISSTLYYSRFDEHRRESTVIDAIAAQVVKNFDKKFLVNNAKFKKTIVDCINYHNINEKKLKFQFIPVEYIQVFKIDKDVHGHGQSMIKKSLFYAKLYLMILLFKIMTIILNSNDTKVNYVKQSGIDKNIYNKVQEIARIRQNRQINMTDLFSYTTLINKVGNGAEMYVPVGRSGERPIETEILQGQDVQLNTDLMEMLKNAYILGTGVPAAIINYLNEADFAKQIEQNNTKFNGRVVNYQLDFNPAITGMYRKILKSSSNLTDAQIAAFEFILQPPKKTATEVKTELIDQTERLTNFLVNLFFEDPSQTMNENIQEEIKQFKIKVAENQLQALNIDEVRTWVEDSKILAARERLRPQAANGDSGVDSYDDLMSDNEPGLGNAGTSTGI